MSQSLDVNKECIATFLCYLEQRNWLRIINIFNDTCKLKWSGGEAKLKALSQKVSAVAEAVKLAGNGKLNKNTLLIAFMLKSICTDGIMCVYYLQMLSKEVR